MEDRYITVLIELEKRGIDIEVLSTGLMYDLFGNKEELNQPSEWTTEYIIDRFMDVMASNGHTFKSIEKDPNDETKVKTITRLTSNGLKYLNEYRLTKSNIDLNNSIKSNIKKQLFIGFVTLAAIIVTAVCAVITYNKGDSENLILIRQSMQQQEQLEQQLQQLQKERNTYLRIMATKNETKKKTVLNSKLKALQPIK